MQGTPISVRDLEIHAAEAEIVTWQGHQALRLENGLALAPELSLRDASVEVFIGTEGPAYPGVAFRLADVLNFELAYAVPHVTGQWDALQYDPVFHGSNTWQLYHGRGYQRAAQIPTGRWFRLRLDFCGNRATVAVDGQDALTIERLARPMAAGSIGLWTFRPAYFSDLRLSTCERIDVAGAEIPGAAAQVIDAWFVEGFGVATCEPSGVLNLNRYLPTSLGKAHLLRRFSTSTEQEVTLEFGFSDRLALQLDGSVVFEGENTFGGFTDRRARGYVGLGTRSHRQMLPAGSHSIAAELEVTEGFGWGIVLAASGPDLHWLPPELA